MSKTVRPYISVYDLRILMRSVYDLRFTQSLYTTRVYHTYMYIVYTSIMMVRKRERENRGPKRTSTQQCVRCC